MANQRLRYWAKQLLPPALHRRLADVAARRGSQPLEWEYLPGGWPGPGELPGWDVASVVEKQAGLWDDFLRLSDGPGPLGLAHEAAQPHRESLPAHNTIMSFAYVLALAARQKQRLSILDWGGGLGQYFVLASRLLPTVELDYTVKDLPLLCQKGRELLPQVTFSSDSAQVLEHSYDLVLASSSLQYSRHWQDDLASLAGAAGRCLFITRTPFVREHSSFVVVQRPHSFGYHTEYPGWFLNRQELLNLVHLRGLVLQREFLVDEQPHVPGAPEQAVYRGFLFVRDTP